MKGYYESISFDNLVHSLEKLYQSGQKNKLVITILTWQDGDYFEELCEEDGGVIPEHLAFFRNKPLAKKLNGFDDLKEQLYVTKRIPVLTSRNGNYKLFYDTHIWIDRNYFCYNIYLGKCFYRIQNIIQHLFGTCIDPEWGHLSYQ